MNAKEYAALSTQLGQIATRVTPDDHSPVANTGRLAMFHLRAAARELQRLAEWTANQEDAEAKP